MTNRVIAVLSVLILAAPGAAFADSINFMGTGKGLAVSIDSPSLGTINVHAGELRWQFVEPAPAGLATQFLAFCVDANSWLVNTDQLTMSPVPEPGSLLLLGSGLALAWRSRRRLTSPR